MIKTEFMELYEELSTLNEANTQIDYLPVSDVELFKEYADDILDGYGNMSDADIKNSIKEIHSEGKLAGYIGFSEYEENGNKCLGIGNFMIIERGKGLGSAVIQDIVEKYKNQYDLIYCFVDAKNDGAIRLYKKLGKVYDEDGPNDNGEYYVTFWDNGKWELDENLEKETDLVFLSDKNMNGKTLTPRVPNNFLIKNGYEDSVTPRVCFADSIDKALMAISRNLTGEELYVHQPKNINKKAIYKPSIKEVPDVKITGEIWYKEPVELKCIGKILVTSDDGKDGHKYTYGNKTAELYGWNWELIKLYNEEPSGLNESKADTQKLIDFAGEDLANRFLAVRARLKAPENDLYYWIKNKTVNELETAILALENTKFNTSIKKELTSAGAQLVNENDSWRVYHITSYEAARIYGRDTKWCITGIDNNGDFYWKDYHDVRGVEFYFFITKQHYDPRGNTSKYALAIWPKKRAYEIYSQQDDLVPLSQVPFIKDLEIPGVDFTKLKPYKLPATPKCRYCGFEIYICDDADYRMTDNDTKFYHPVCWYEKFKPDQVEDLTSLFINGIGIARVNVTEPYHEALTRIINTIKSLNPQQKQSLILSWDKEKPFKPLVSIRAGKLTINDSSAGAEIEQVFKN